MEEVTRCLGSADQRGWWFVWIARNADSRGGADVRRTSGRLLSARRDSSHTGSPLFANRRVPRRGRTSDDFGATVLEVGGAGLVWGLDPPGDLRAANVYWDHLVADVELRDVTPAAPASAQTGIELAEAAALPSG